jgi:predicted transcriptional regulator
VPRKVQRITDAELAVLKVLWERGPLPARAISNTIYPDGAESEFASVHSFLQSLERKGLVHRDRTLFVHIFHAAASQSDVAGQELDALADRLSDGSLTPFLTHLVQRKRLSKKDAAMIRKLLDTRLK